MAGKEIARLEQSKRGKGKQSFILYEEGTLLITVSKGGNLQHFSVSLMGWDPEPAHEKNYPRTSRVVLKIISVILCVFFALVGAALFFSSGKGIAPILFVVVVLGISWAVLYNLYLLQSYDVLIFRNPATGGQFALHNNVPGEKEFSAFVEALKTVIKKFPSIPLWPTNTTVAELREFARLRDDGILTNEEFEEAKRKLLSNMNSSSSMGFRP
ncbi:MAG: SHOCT domain-containing protein [Kiritimatiellaeota bacterium]|nr:SHOCT domain-containing protein [Kiritimatiellota bacterium]